MQLHGQVLGGDKQFTFVTLGAKRHRTKTCPNLTYPKVNPPISNTHRKTNTMYHMHILSASKCMHVVHSVGFVIAVGFR